MALKLMSSGGGSVTLDVPSTASNLAMTVPAAAGTVPYVDTSGILQGITSGIKFPATQVPSADGNTLDDYEEGSWTPSISCTSTPGTWVPGGTNGGRYVRVGQMFIASFSCHGTFSGGSGNARIAGLPFQFNGNAYGAHAYISYYSAPTAWSYPITAYGDGGATFVNLQKGYANYISQTEAAGGWHLIGCVTGVLQ